MSEDRLNATPWPSSDAKSSKFLPTSQLVYSLVIGALYLLAALALALLGLASLSNQGDQSSVTLISLAWGSALIGFLMLPAAALAIFRLSSNPLPGWMLGFLKFLDQFSLFFIILWPFVLLAGYLAAQAGSLSWLLLPPLNLLAVSLPIVWILAIGQRGLAGGSPLRRWGSFSIAVVLSPVLSFTIELAVLFGLGLLAVFLVASHPDTVAEINRFSQRLLNSQGNPETITRMLRPFLSRPEILYGGLALMSGLIPLIEELLKPLPVWLLGKRLKTPAEGFVAGLIGGAGYALAESLGASGAFDSTQWLGTVLGRGGTDLLHILTAGLMGAALIYAWQSGKYWRLVLTYLSVVLIHGLWNFFSLWSGFYSFIAPTPVALPVNNSLLGYISPLGLGILVIGMLAILISQNARLRKAPAFQAPGPLNLPGPLSIQPGPDQAVEPAGATTPESDLIPLDKNLATGKTESEIETPAPTPAKEPPAPAPDPNGQSDIPVETDPNI